jgi:hypothetical protein
VASSILSQYLEAARMRALLPPLRAVLPQLSLAVILWYGGRQAGDGQIPPGSYTQQTRPTIRQV